MKKAALAIALITAASAQAGEMYKCVDPETGRVTLSQTACGADAKAVELKGYQTTPSDAAKAPAPRPVPPAPTASGKPDATGSQTRHGAPIPLD